MKILIICSKAFYGEVPSIQKQLEDLGYTVFLPNCITNPEMEDQMRAISEYEHSAFKAKMYRQSHQLISNVDAVLVLNFEKDGIEGYIGGATFLEMYDAHMLNKAIFIYNDPFIANNIFRDEIRGFSPKIINGDLTKIIIKLKMSSLYGNSMIDYNESEIRARLNARTKYQFILNKIRSDLPISAKGFRDYVDNQQTHRPTGLIASDFSEFHPRDVHFFPIYSHEIIQICFIKNKMWCLQNGYDTFSINVLYELVVDEIIRLLLNNKLGYIICASTEHAKIHEMNGKHVDLNVTPIKGEFISFLEEYSDYIPPDLLSRVKERYTR